LNYGGLGGRPYKPNSTPNVPIASIPQKPPVTRADKANKVIDKQFNK
jgi:hypothetical protein